MKACHSESIAYLMLVNQKHLIWRKC